MAPFPVGTLAPTFAMGAKPPSINAVLEVDNSDNGSANGAVYKGMTSADVNESVSSTLPIFARRVEVYDTTFKRVRLDEDAFEAEGVPRGFAPFNVQNIGGTLFVTYAKQDAPRHDPVVGLALFCRNLYSLGQAHRPPRARRLVQRSLGVVWTTRDFGEFSNAILVGNFRSGWIAAFNGFTHKFIGFVRNPDNSLCLSMDCGRSPSETMRLPDRLTLCSSPPASTMKLTVSLEPSLPSTASTATKSSAARSSLLAVHIQKTAEVSASLPFFSFQIQLKSLLSLDFLPSIRICAAFLRERMSVKISRVPLLTP